MRSSPRPVYPVLVAAGLLAAAVVAGCASGPAHVLTANERRLVRAGGPDEPMRLVLNSNREGDARLRTPSLEADPADPDVALLIRRMMATVKDAEGVGLAAPQVGINRRLIVVQRLDVAPEQPFEAYCNPEITRLSRTEVVDWEGCLSVPAGFGRVARANAIHVAYDEPDGRRAARRVSGFTARIFQHEIDHLDGVLFFDRMPDPTLVSREELRAWKRRMGERAGEGATERAGEADAPAPPEPPEPPEHAGTSEKPGSLAARE